MRIGGIASGLDVEQMVKDIMRAERQPLDRVYQQQVRATWKQEAYREINSSLSKLRDAAFDLRLQSTFVSQSATSSNETAVTARATGASAPGSYEVSVQSLAEQASVTSAAGAESRFEQFVAEHVPEDGEYTFSISGVSFTVTENTTLEGLVREISASRDAGLSVFYDPFTEQAVFRTENTGRSARLDVDLEPEDSGQFLHTVFGLGAAADLSVDRGEGVEHWSVSPETVTQGLRVVIGDRTYGVWDSSASTYADETQALAGLGADLVLDLNGVGDARQELLNLIWDDRENLGEGYSLTTLDAEVGTFTVESESAQSVQFSQTVANGENAVVSINGLATERESNTFDLAGTVISLHDEAQNVVISVQQDVDAAMEKIMGFVELYNEVIEEVGTAVNERYYRDFPPLTDEQRGAMSDQEIELWEERAKSGLLRNDSILNSIVSDLRLAMGSAVSGADFSSLSEIGITTGPWQERGRLHVNEDRLRQALASDAQGVMSVFAKSGEDGTDLGVARQISNRLNAGVRQITDRAGRESVAFDQSYLGRRIRNFNTQMSRLEDRLAATEERYWSQFTAMERAFFEMNNQSDWLYQQMMTMTPGG